jgi:hypothetical protein
VGGLGFLGYRNYASSNPVPTPGPTANLAPIEVAYSKIFKSAQNDYDFLAKVTNPNTDYGSPDVRYEINFFDNSGNTVSTKEGSFYILPGQTKYVANLPLKFSSSVAGAELAIKSVEWEKIDPLASSGVNLFVRNAAFNRSSEVGVYGKVGGGVLNNSDYDLSGADVVVVLLDQDGEPIAVNKTQIDTFLSKTTREFEVTWYSPFTGQVDKVDTEANTNLFENSNFLRQYGGGQEKFQKQY